MPAKQTNAFQILNEAGLEYTPIPNALLDYWLTRLTPGELAVMLYLYRRTLGYHKLRDRLSYDQFLRGITTREGQRLDDGAGVSRRTLVTALASLEKRGFLRRYQGQRGQAVLFEVCLEPLLVVQPPAQQVGPTRGQAAKPAQGQKLHPVAPQEDYPLPVQQVHPAPPDDTPVIDEVQQLHSLAVQELAVTVQKLPVKEAYPVQNSIPSKEKPVTQNINRSGEYVSVIEAGAKLLEQTIPGLTRLEAHHLAATCLGRYGHDLLYLQSLADYVRAAPGIRNPAALLTSLIHANAERQVARPALYQPVPRPIPSPVVSNFSKYQQGGKYGYLTRPQPPLLAEVNPGDYRVAV